MKKFLSLLLAVMLCCAVFVSCGKAEQEPEASPEPSVEVAEGKFSDEEIEDYINDTLTEQWGQSYRRKTSTGG